MRPMRPTKLDESIEKWRSYGLNLVELSWDTFGTTLSHKLTLSHEISFKWANR